MEMRVKKVEHGLDRRSFLRDSGFAAGGIVGMAATAPVISFAKPTEQLED